MNLDSRNPALLRHEAHSVAIRSEEPFVAWSELKRWSLGKGPAGTKAAVIEFMEQHGRKPESAAIIPEIARMAYAMPEPDRREMLELTHSWFSVSAGFERAVSPISRAIGSIFPAKKAQERQAPAPHPDIARMMEQRDMIFHVNRGGLDLPPGSKKTAIPPKLPLRRGTFAPVLTASHGHALVHSLAEKLSIHGHEGHRHVPEVREERETPAPKKTKRKAARRPVARKKSKTAPARRSHTRARKKGKVRR